MYAIKIKSLDKKWHCFLSTVLHLLVDLKVIVLLVLSLTSVEDSTQAYQCLVIRLDNGDLVLFHYYLYISIMCHDPNKSFSKNTCSVI